MTTSTAGGRTADAIVVGGGMVGAAIAFGLQRDGLRTLILDEGDIAFRAARGNFGLVWVQGKGRGMQRYAEWTRQSATRWGDFAADVRERTGIDTGHVQPGGLSPTLGEGELEAKRQMLAEMQAQSPDRQYDAKLLDRQQTQEMMGARRLGPEVTGALYCPHDGHVDPLRLLRALHAAFAAAGGRYLPEAKVSAIHRLGDGFEVMSGAGRMTCGRLVLAAGNGLPDLARMLEFEVPTRPQRGQILVTERIGPGFLPMPLHKVRQTPQGSLLVGDSQEDVGFDDRTTIAATAQIADRAVRMLPELRQARLVRSWAALRVLPPDGFPIYQEIPEAPGAFVATMHSGVTLAALHATALPAWIASGQPPPDFEAFSTSRFRDDAPQA